MPTKSYSHPTTGDIFIPVAGGNVQNVYVFSPVHLRQKDGLTSRCGEPILTEESSSTIIQIVFEVDQKEGFLFDTMKR